MARVRPAFLDSDSDEEEMKGEVHMKDAVHSKLKHDLSKFTKQRNELKERVMKEAIHAAFPDFDEFNVDDFVVGKAEPKKQHIMVEVMKVLGCWPVSIHEAVANGSFKQLKKVLFKLSYVNKVRVPVESINDLNDKGHTALSAAVRIRRHDMAELLLHYNCEPNIVDEITGMSPLMYSVASGNLVTSSMLLSYDADVNLTDFNGVSCLMVAASLGDTDHLQLLISHKANIDFVDKNGWTALHYAAFGGSPVVCTMLLDEGIDRNQRDNNRRKALHIAKIRNHGECVAVLEDLSTSQITHSYLYK